MSTLPRVVFAGTPEFAAAALRAVLAAGFPVPLVLTQPDRPAGRGMKLLPSAVKQVALDHGIEVFQPLSLRKDVAAVERLRQVPFDVMVVAAYGLILPRSVLDIPSQGCINIHASLLPRWRGAAPIQRAIEAGDTSTGICIMLMEEGLDTGPVLACEELAIEHSDTAASLHDRLMHLGASSIVAALRHIDQLTAVPQAAEGVTYASKIEKAEATLDFAQPAELLARRLRAFDPFPGCAFPLKGALIKAWAGEALPPTVFGQAEAGSVLAADAAGLVVACGTGALRLTSLQKPGGKRLSPREFLQGFPVAPGDRVSA